MPRLVGLWGQVAFPLQREHFFLTGRTEESEKEEGNENGVESLLCR